ncbi:MAG TPA: nucleotidyltransferase [Gemmatimonas sp.]|uniref:nucleotidyltransferase n=1 Tax=Gemmatimonas sp. TaxID=1962908 RepID=UPI002ED98615
MTPAGEGRPNAVGDEDFPSDFRDFIHELNAHAVEYLLVGGYAVGLYGHVRATADIDFLYRTTPENVERLMQAMAAFGAPGSVVNRDQLSAPMGVTQFGAPPVRIDLLSDITGVSFDEAQVDALAIEIAGERLPVIGLAALRKNKQATGRKKDRDDLRRLPTSLESTPRRLRSKRKKTSDKPAETNASSAPPRRR